MKYDKKLFVSRLTAQRRALFLLYGTEEPSITSPPPRLLPYKRVAELMRVKLSFVHRLKYEHFHPRDPASKRLSL
jgi:hypothetical protein